MDLGNVIEHLHVLETSSIILHLNLYHVVQNALIYCNISDGF